MTPDQIAIAESRMLVARLKTVLFRAESGQALSRCGCESSTTSNTELGKCVRCCGTGWVTALPADHKPLGSSITPEDWRKLDAMEREWLEPRNG